MTPKKSLRRPGIEPGSTAWKAAMLTIIPPTPLKKKGLIFDYLNLKFENQ